MDYVQGIKTIKFISLHILVPRFKFQLHCNHFILSCEHCCGAALHWQTELVEFIANISTVCHLLQPRNMWEIAG